MIKVIENKCLGWEKEEKEYSYQDIIDQGFENSIEYQLASKCLEYEAEISRLKTKLEKFQKFCSGYKDWE